MGSSCEIEQCCIRALLHLYSNCWFDMIDAYSIFYFFIFKKSQVIEFPFPSFFLFCLKEWIKHKRLLRMGFPGCIWVIGWLWIRLWHKLCGFRWPGFEKISQALCKMVLQVFEGKKHQLRWCSYWTWEEYIISLSFSLLVGSVHIMGQL